MGTYRDYTEIEEKLNYGTHFIALSFYLIACPYLIVNAIKISTTISISGLIIYSIGLVAVFSTSSLYHFTKSRELKTKYRTLDHMAIFLLIGGTYTPVVQGYISEPTASIFLAILWLLLIGGIVMKFFFMGKYKAFSIGLYIFLGCMVLLIIKPIVEAMPHDIFILTLLGGVAYLVGVLFYINKKTEYTHTIWHLFVMLASFLHFMAIFKTSLNV